MVSMEHQIVLSTVSEMKLSTFSLIYSCIYVQTNDNIQGRATKY